MNFKLKSLNRKINEVQIGNITKLINFKPIHYINPQASNSKLQIQIEWLTDSVFFWIKSSTSPRVFLHCLDLKTRAIATHVSNIISNLIGDADSDIDREDDQCCIWGFSFLIQSDASSADWSSTSSAWPQYWQTLTLS